MITDERTAAFIESFDAGNTELLEELERYALANRVPIIKRPVQSLLKFVLSAKHPERILEVGTAIGFSAILMAEYGREVSQIVTIENYEKRIPIALDNFKRAGMADRITLIAEDAAEALESLCKSDERFDMIFVDAAKAQYINYLPFVKAMLNDGGLLISDNVLQDGDIIQSRFAVTRRDRTIHSRMREYLRVISDDPELVTTILPIGDGVTMSVKRSEHA